MPVTQQQIAKHLGISRSLVARSLGGDTVISDATRKSVAEAATRLGYDHRANMGARVLIAKCYGKRVRTDIVAILMPTADHGWGLSTPFFEELLKAIEEEAGRRGFDIYICGHHNRRFPALVADQAVDGILCVGHPQIWEPKIAETGLPVISFFRVPPSDAFQHHCSFLVADRQGMKQAVRHLAGLGHRKIAYLGYRSIFHSGTERLIGYREGLAEAGLEADETRIEATIDTLTASEGALDRLRARTRDWTALVCYNDAIAMDSISALERAGLTVPGDISVVGFDDVSVQQGFQPRITSFNFDRNAMGRRALEVLCELLTNSMKPQVSSQWLVEEFPVELVVRESTGPCTL